MTETAQRCDCRAGNSPAAPVGSASPRPRSASPCRSAPRPSHAWSSSAAAPAAQPAPAISPRTASGALAVTLVEQQQHYTTCFYSNLYLAGWRDLKSLTHGYGGLQSAGVKLVPIAGRGRGSRGQDGATGERRDPGLRQARRRPRHRPEIRLHRGLQRGCGRDHAAQLEGRRSDRAVAAQARGDAGRRPVRDRGTTRTLPLPAGALRARERGRILSHAGQAQVQDPDSRRQGQLHQAGAVRGGLEHALQGSGGMGAGRARWQGDRGRRHGR